MAPNIWFFDLQYGPPAFKSKLIVFQYVLYVQALIYLGKTHSTPDMYPVFFSYVEVVAENFYMELVSRKLH